MIQKVSVRVGRDELVLETNRMAKQANGAVFATYGGSAVLATVCSSPDDSRDPGYFPLSVEYNEKGYAGGIIPGGWPKREGRPQEKEILVSRLIDRPIRPLFPKGYRNDVQVIPTTVATDKTNPPDVVGMVAASAAVTISDIPFDGPIGAVRICHVGDALIVNPTFAEMAQADLNIVVAGTEKGITMVEGGGHEISEDLVIRAIETAHESIKLLCSAQRELAAKAGKPKETFTVPEPPAGLVPVLAKVREAAHERYRVACFVKGKKERGRAMAVVRDEVVAPYREQLGEDGARWVRDLFEEMEYEIVRKSILERGIRSDGRGPDDIRPITCEVAVLPRTHGSALFTRGETQALVVLTLGSESDEKILEDIEGDRRKRFMLHYNFPPFSVGETGRLGPGRRDIGHGHLAERALANMVPPKSEFPYTVRIVSEILESNGSSSMATVCGGTLALLDGGVKMTRPVAGIAMGLVSDGSRTVVLSDILGEEDHLGDMDFKVAGTYQGITAFQMDIKLKSVSAETLGVALEKARVGRTKILDIMTQTLSAPRPSLSPYAPKILTVRIDPDKIGLIIGTGGKTIKGITEQTGATINIEETGQINIYCVDEGGAEAAAQIIAGMVAEPEVGREYDGVVKRIMDFGAFIEYLPGREGLCHISKMADHRVESVTDVLSEGQKVRVRLIEVDRMGRVNLALATYEDRPRPASSADGESPVSDRPEGRREGGERSRRPPAHGGRGGGPPSRGGRDRPRHDR
jgi:polyribonucleotide nucleotidyltransferase